MSLFKLRCLANNRRVINCICRCRSNDSASGSDSCKSDSSSSDKNKCACSDPGSGDSDKETKVSICDVCKAYPCECNPSSPTMYECRKYSHNLPCDSAAPHFETLPHIPTGIFRCTAGEVLGRGANKCSYYQNPEYFSYHHMTFYDMHMVLRTYRKASPKTGRKKN